MAVIFSKLLRKTDINSSKLVVPTDALWSHFRQILGGRHCTGLVVMDWVGGLWNFRLWTRPNGPYEKPVFTVDWARFVKEKGLREGDELIFSANQDGDGGFQYKILVQRRPHSFTLRGEPIVMDVNEIAPYTVPNHPAPTYELNLFS
ncbi:hypothetical protein EZV62_019164 [Acer yangbiense]|uniref:TF-B3 domain-containing protein n=1 Tax=Acer yangbiense TaxID=1000413 RepID=A0A5C7HAH2_9ROSI|nr:hypothetical protein EZV62_019164 [Acer yangbiense]